MVQCCFTSRETIRRIGMGSPGQPHTAPELSEKWDKLFKALKVWKLSGVCELCGLQSVRKNCQLTSQKWHFRRPNNSLTRINLPRKITKNALPISFDRVRRPSAAVRVVPLYQMGRRVAYLCVAFPCHIAKVHKKGFFCMNPVIAC